MSSEKAQAEIQKLVNFAETLRKKTVIPNLEIENFLNFQYSEIKGKNIFNCCTVEKLSVSKQFKRAFRTLSRYEQASYYSNCVKIVVHEIFNIHKKVDTDEEIDPIAEMQQDDRKSQFETFTILFKKESHFSKWIMSKVEVALELNILRIIHTDQQLDLQNYILRDSKNKEKQCLVLESIEGLTEPQTLRISNYTEELSELKKRLTRYMDKALKAKISRVLKKNRATLSTDNYHQSIRASIKVPDYFAFGKDNSSNRPMELNTKRPATIQLCDGDHVKSLRKIVSQELKKSVAEHESKKIHAKLVSRETIFALSSFKDFEQVEKGLYFNKKQEKIRKVFTFEREEMNYEWLVTQMNRYKVFKKWKPCLFSINLLAEIPNEKTKIYHEINLYKDYSEIDYVYLRHLFEIDSVNYYIDKSINTEEYGSGNRENRGIIDYCLWRFRKINDKIEVLVELKFEVLKTKSIVQTATEFIGEVDLLKKQYLKNDRLHEDSLQTVHNSNLYLFEDESELSVVDEDEVKQKRSSRRAANVNQSKKLIEQAVAETEVSREIARYRQSKKVQQKEEVMENAEVKQNCQPQEQVKAEQSCRQVDEQSEYFDLQADDARFSRSDTQYFTIASSFSSDSQRGDEETKKLDFDMVELQQSVKKLESQINQTEEIEQPCAEEQKISEQQNLAEERDQVDEEKQINQPRCLSDKLLETVHLVNPEEKDREQAKVLSKKDQGHFLWGNQWEVTSKGALTNINKQQIEVQSSVLKLILRRMGRNLLSGKSILNVSLPIEIFGTDTNLERLCKCTAYAPIFLQKAATLESPLERMKNTICFGLGFSLLYIDMQKPFNPILGQTYQGVVDGCPVYGEQTSHHPPISSILVKGRGYDVYGNLEAKVQMGMNSVSGINQGTMTVSYLHHNSSVKFNCPPGELSGLVYGDRVVTLTRKSFYYDQSNLLLAVLEFGRKKAKNSICQFNDYFQGRILKLKQPIEFNSKLDKIKDSQIEETLSYLEGRWTQEIRFDQKLEFDVAHDAPCLLQDYQKPLLSDCSMRKDLILRKKGQIAEGQEAKEFLQELQRGDRKLRKNAKGR